MDIDYRRRSSDLKTLAVALLAGVLLTKLPTARRRAYVVMALAAMGCYYLGTDWEDK